MTQQRVREFHLAMGNPAPDFPVGLDNYNGVLRYDLIREELDEFASAINDDDKIAVVDALVDLLYVVYGAGVELGVDLEPFFALVHKNNLLKQGGPIADNGKQLKPEGWKHPDLAELYREIYGVDP